MAYFAIDGSTMIDIKVSPLLILSFGFPPMDPASFYSTNLVANLAILLNISPDKIRRVNIVSASNQTRIRRQTSRALPSIQLQIELRDEPRTSSTATTGIRAEILSNVASTIINRYQSGELQEAWKNLNITNGTAPSVLNTQEPFDNSSVELNTINKLLLITPPNDCRQQSPCTIQPVLVAYNVEGNVIQKLGSKDRPWQVKASVIGRPNLILPGGIANYSGGQTQYTLFGLPDIGTQQVQFNLIPPDGVNSSFLATTNLTVQTAFVSVTRAILAGQQVNNIYVVNVNETFSVTLMPVDSITLLKLGKIQWGSWTWSANVTLRSLPKLNRYGSLVQSNLSSTNIDLTEGTVTVTNLAINATGMYMLQILMVSSNNDHSIVLLSNGILVKDDTVTLITESDSFSSNITFAGDFDALNSSGKLEEKRTMICNHMINVGMPLISDIIVFKGSVVVTYEADTLAPNVSAAVSKLLSDPGAIPDLTLTSVNMFGRTYVPSSASSSSSGSDTGNVSTNVALIVGLVVGLVGGLLVIFGVVWLYRAHERMISRHRLGVEETDEDKLTGVDANGVASPKLDNHVSSTNLDGIELFSPIFINQTQSKTSNRNLNNFQAAKPVLPSSMMEIIAFD
ncbi:unnamed protein product [Rotaria magnacalcarata]|nr:unnamed protein product [Rotaria magnacalcarata]